MRVRHAAVLVSVLMVGLTTAARPPLAAEANERRLLYVAVPGIRNYVEYGGIGVLVYDVANGHRLVRRIPTFDLRAGEAPENVKGIAASASTARLYVTTQKRLAAF